MKRYVEGLDRRQTFPLPESLDDYVDENNPVRVIEVFVEALDLTALGFGVNGSNDRSAIWWPSAAKR